MPDLIVKNEGRGNGVKTVLVKCAAAHYLSPRFVIAQMMGSLVDIAKALHTEPKCAGPT